MNQMQSHGARLRAVLSLKIDFDDGGIPGSRFGVVRGPRKHISRGNLFTGNKCERVIVF